MRKEDFERIAREKPFKAFEVRLVDGRAFRFTSPEQFIVCRSVVVTPDENEAPLLINLNLIATVQQRNGRKPAKA